jgi:hypothetical protein
MDSNLSKFLKLAFWTLFVATIFIAALMRMAAHRRVIDFNIMDFEWPEDKTYLHNLIVEWSADPEKRNLLLDQLGMDYIFMSVLFPAILILCLLSELRLTATVSNRNNNYKVIRNLLLIAGWLQILAWTFDFCENTRLENWLVRGSVDRILLFKEMVFMKFTIGIVGFLLGSGTYLYTLLIPKKAIYLIK